MDIHEVYCPYCNAIALLESSTKIYGKDFGLAYICSNYPTCDAYVGVHKKDNKPLGRLANKELRNWKMRAHSVFDPLWQRKLVKRKKERGESYKKYYARGSGYKWLAEQLGIDKKHCHIGQFDVETCKRVVQLCKPYNLTKNNEDSK